MPAVVAIDIGGTKLAAGLVDDHGRVLDRRQVPTPDGDAEVLWAALVGVAAPFVASSVAPIGVGIGCGGPMTGGGELVSPLNIAGWRSFPLRERVARQWRLPVHIDNDAKALALAEGWAGAARGVQNFLAMVVSTGVGGGIVLDGRLLDGVSTNAGHIGHVVVEPGGAVLPGHAPGTLEAEVSGLAIEVATGRPPAEADQATIERSGRLVGRAVGSVCNLLDLRLALVAGSVALGFGEPFFAAAQHEVDQICVLDFSRGARIIPAGLGVDGPLVGAAAVGWRGMGHDIGIG